MAVLILMLCLLLSISTTIAAGNGEQIMRYNRNVRLSVSDVTDESATLEWVVPDEEVTQKGFKITCNGNTLNTPVYGDPDEFEALPIADIEEDPTNLNTNDDVKVLYAFEDASSIAVRNLKPRYEYSCSLMVGRKNEGDRPWRELIEPITFETLSTETVSTTAESTEPEGKLSAALSFSKNYRKMLALIILGGVLPIFLLLGCLGVCILYCKCKTARMKDKRYAAFARSLKNKKKATEIAELGLSPGMIDHGNPPWMVGQNMFQTYAQPQVQGNARSSRWSRSKNSQRFNAPITSIRLNDNESQKYTTRTAATTGCPKRSSSSSSSDSDIMSVNNLQIPHHIQTLSLSSTAFGINRTPHSDRLTTLSRSQSTNGTHTVSTNQPPARTTRRTRTRKTPASRPVLTSESSSETTGVPYRQPLPKGSRSLSSMRGTKSKMPAPKPIPRRANSTQLTLLDILASIPLPPDQDGY